MNFEVIMITIDALFCLRSPENFLDNSTKREINFASNIFWGCIDYRCIFRPKNWKYCFCLHHIIAAVHMSTPKFLKKFEYLSKPSRSPPRDFSLAVGNSDVIEASFAGIHIHNLRKMRIIVSFLSLWEGVQFVTRGSLIWKRLYSCAFMCTYV